MENEQDRAAHYETHRGDDLDEWGDAAPAKLRRRLAAMVSVRLTPEELDVVREAAVLRGVSLSAFLRTAALAEAGERVGLGARSPYRARAASTSVDVTLISTPLGGPADAEKLGVSTGVVASAA